ncbi:phage tail protein [Caballeronia sp. LZ065]|uniref:phage tail protein n=1 Tax=Caballeronia sp. LZ065 TaxID=3038571 RepID=UPI00285561DC|nr:phage tail protein [Caballeronia sp. LZ065]MDR5782022.1 phage tail protein [Caballeronia sp. LZ065]
MERGYFEPSTAHHFSVLFVLNRVPIPDVLDMRFQKVHGLSRELNVMTHNEGGENLRNQYFTEKLSHGSLVLERGVMALTPLTALLSAQFASGKITYLSAVITLLHPGLMPLTNWLVTKAVPVRWQTGDLNAQGNEVLINTFELRYRDMIPLGVKL